MISAGKDGTLRIWNVFRGKQDALVNAGDRDGIKCLWVNDLHKKALAGCVNSEVLLLNLEFGHIDAVFTGHSQDVTCVTAPKDLLFFVSGSRDCSIRVWVTKECKLMTVLRRHQLTVTCLSLTEDNKRLISGSYDKTVRIWALNHGIQEKVIEIGEKVTSLAVTQQSRMIITGSVDAKIRLWNLEQLSAKEEATLAGHTDGITCLVAHPDGKLLISGSYDGKIIMWNLNECVQERFLEGHDSTVTCLCLTRDNAKIVSASSNNEIKVWNAEIGSHSDEIFGKHGGIVSVKFDRSNTDRLFTLGIDRNITVWHRPSHSPLSTFGKSSGGHTERVTGMVVTSNGQEVYTCSMDKTIIGWNVEDQKIIKTLYGHESCVSDIHLLPGDEWLLSASEDRTARLWNLENGKDEVIFRGHTDIISCITSTHNKELVFTGSLDRTISMWVNPKNTGKKKGDTKTDEQTQLAQEVVTAEFIFLKHSAAIVCLAVSKDDEKLISSSRDCTIIVWDILSQYPEKILKNAHRASINGIVCSPTEDIFYSASKDRVVKKWDLKTITEDKVLLGAYSTIYCLDIDDDGTEIVAGEKSDRIMTFAVKNHPQHVFRYLYLLKRETLNDLLHIFQAQPTLFKLRDFFPMEASLLTVYAYLGRIRQMKQFLNMAIKLHIPVPLKADSSGNTALQVAIEDKNAEMIQTLLQYYQRIQLPNYLENLHATICQLLTIPDVTDLSEFVDSRLLIPINREDYTKRAILSGQHLATNYSYMMTPKLSRRLIYNDTEDSASSDYISIKYIDIPQITDPSLRFLKHLLTAPPENPIFESRVVQAILNYKWYFFGRKKLIVSFVFYLVFLAVFQIYLLWVFPKRDSDAEGLANTLRGCLLTYVILDALRELYQACKMSKTRYFASPWNGIDILRILALFLSMTLDSAGAGDRFMRILHSIVNWFVWMKMLSYLRAMKASAGLIHMILQTVKDMVGFFLILFVNLMSISVSIHLLVEDSEGSDWTSTLETCFVMLFGEINVPEPNQSAFFMWLFITFFMVYVVIILFNLLIAIIGDTYDRVKSNLNRNINYELASFLYEEENLINIWIFHPKSKPENQKYLFVAAKKTEEDNDDENSDSWEGWMKELQNRLKKHFKTMQDELVELRNDVLFQQELQLGKLRQELVERQDTQMEAMKDQMLDVRAEIRALSRQMGDYFKSADTPKKAGFLGAFAKGDDGTITEEPEESSGIMGFLDALRR